ncbi:putative ubiquitin-conjugating enzyme E2 25 [Capsicum baccatum]|uniref:Ubiquitin-conjugating enzyme E2 25 n=1 Tax=Capsicum baccatum TaxID=33114 RepID=A0A2G2VJ50_CAPBA|nr:putative ubiquitin-conjugating enzyme E2 25 [Capsicum baccatum]
MKEWKILEKHLPESIYVRTYELRMDLLRAVIVGAAGTPYHDELFFFDIVFPSDYPNQPPNISYLSRGYHMNPNLYIDGYVCFSLINIWSGNWMERWNSKTSTILQLLVSIQGLVLNAQPYFNEPDRENYIKDEYFRERGEFILSAVNAYGNGNATAGHYQVNHPPSSRVHNSAQFQNNSKKMFVELEMLS